MLGIIAAMRVEAMELIEKMTEREERTISGVTFTSGKLCGRDAVIAVCGIGKVFAALCTQTMILTYHPDAIVNTGVAGTLTDKLSICDMALSVDLVQHDMDTSAVGDPVGMISGINMIYIPCDEKVRDTLKAASEAAGAHCVCGRIASGDIFVTDSESRENIKKTFGAAACEMEGAAVGQVCYVNKVPFGILRTVSDNGNAAEDYPSFAKAAADISSAAAIEFVKRI